MDRKVLSLGFVVTAFCLPVAADDYKFFGAGLNLSSSNADVSGTVSHKGINLAYGYEFGLESLEEAAGFPVAILASAGFETRGEDFESPEVDYAMRYLQVPVLAKASYRKEKTLLSLYAGPEAGVFLWRTVTVEEDGEINNSNLPDVNRFDFGLSLGAGVEAVGDEMGLYVQVFRYHGFLDAIQDDSRTPEDDSKDSKHRNWKFQAGLKFRTRW